MPWKPRVNPSTDAVPTPRREQLKAERHPGSDDAQQTILQVVRTFATMLIEAVLDELERRGFDPRWVKRRIRRALIPPYPGAGQTSKPARS
jgi:hypothetical protein